MKITITLSVLILIPLFFITPNACAGTSLDLLSKKMEVVSLKNAKELERIVEQMIQARLASQKALSQEEIAEIRAQAEEVLRSQKEADVDAGAMVYTGCQIISP